MSTTNNMHPSNRLSRGEVTDFLSAMRCVIAQCEYEEGFSTGGEASDFKLMSGLKEWKAKARKAMEMHAEIVKKAERQLSDALRATGDDEMISFADCLDSEDYSPLAI